MARQPSHPKQLTRSARDLKTHRHDRNPGQHSVYGRVTRAAPEYLGQGDRAHRDPGTPGDSGLQVGTRQPVPGRKP
jgi:hypothetical protein